ncbi:hypothetical protein N7478_002266 [Penicillium angulare]|uniref:uncharacterized protein n=1 Tax=Penicillium angulare TaxID=116970 RepID=UPI002541DE40|nr:uncharacterized protein N7478_002266 [Penicillium angulare]KAJ5289236.1 hypothetical protein N7478_002266 [Penicillium angulare]
MPRTTVVFVTSTKSAGAVTLTTTESSITSKPSISGTLSNTFNESTTSSEGTESTRTHGLSASASAGIGLGTALGVLLLALVAVYIYWRRRKKLVRKVNQEVPVLPELGTNSQKYELSAASSSQAELDADKQNHHNAIMQELD